MTETMWLILDELRRLYLERGYSGYVALWHLENKLNIKLAGCGVPDGRCN